MTTTITEGYVPGCIGRIAQIHAQHYAVAHGFGVAFEAKVASELAGFFQNYQAGRDGIWLALHNGHIEGSIAIDGTQADTCGAHLRWFITTDAIRGHGVGTQLLARAMAFVQACGHRKTYLWTFSGLHAARHLYEAHGFRLVHESPGSQWGSLVTEQRFERDEANPTARLATGTLRPATPDDAAAVTAVLIQSRTSFLPYAPLAHTASDIGSWVETHLIPSGGIVVWTVDHRVVAFIATSDDGSARWIDQLYVLPGWTGQGIGQTLLQHAHRTLARPIRLHTFQQNTPARRFYERHGYQAIGFSDGKHNEEGCPDVLYELPAHTTREAQESPSRD